MKNLHLTQIACLLSLWYGVVAAASGEAPKGGLKPPIKALPNMAPKLRQPIKMSEHLSFHALLIRQDGDPCAPQGMKSCGNVCIGKTHTCCPDLQGGCAPEDYCIKGNNGAFGCCPNGETCKGDGGAIHSPGSVTCDTGYVECENKCILADGNCCVGRDKYCGKGAYCVPSGCCWDSDKPCESGCIPKSDTCCKGGYSCPSGSYCSGTGCCWNGQTCDGSGTGSGGGTVGGGGSGGGSGSGSGGNSSGGSGSGTGSGSGNGTGGQCKAGEERCGNSCIPEGGSCCPGTEDKYCDPGRYCMRDHWGDLVCCGNANGDGCGLEEKTATVTARATITNKVIDEVFAPRTSSGATLPVTQYGGNIISAVSIILMGFVAGTFFV